MEGAAPGEEFVGSAGGYVGGGIEAGGFEGINGFFDAVGILFAAAAYEHFLHSVALQFFRAVCAAAEKTVISESFGTEKSDEFCLDSSHGESCHGAMVAVGDCIEIGIDKRHKFIYQDCLEFLGVKLSDSAEFHVVGHSVGHHDDEGVDFAFGNHIVHDKVGMSLG